MLGHIFKLGNNITREFVQCRQQIAFKDSFKKLNTPNKSNFRKFFTFSRNMDNIETVERIRNEPKGEDFFEDDKETIQQLAEYYSEARSGLNNKWLTFAKTCHIYLHRGGGDPSKNLAAFDLDGTIIKPKSNKRIPKSATDWQMFSVWTKVKLNQIIRENNARFVIFTNQNGIGLKLVPLEEVQERIELVMSRLNIPCTVFVATEKDEFRKPELGMFRLFERSFNNSIEIDTGKSFYCGDAVGYPSHSNADIKFAQNLKLPFLTPEKFLRGVKPKLVGQDG